MDFVPSSNVPAAPKSTAKRNRIPLSCAPCRVRKLRCDRQQPCHNCMVRASGDRCIYANSSVTQGRDVDGSAFQHGGKSHVQGRLHSEDLLYRGSTHWDSVLAELAALTLDDGLQEDTPPFVQWSCSHNGSSSTMNDDLLAIMPSRTTADQLVSRFFDPNCFVGPIKDILHYPTLMKEYQEHWKNPSSTSLSWLGLLYAIFSLAISFRPAGSDDYMDLSGTLATFYHTHSGRCIARIGANKANLLTLQVMIARSVFGFSNREDWGAARIPDVGAIVRIAMRLGLHRDPSHFPNITPFQGEMRRRTWTVICQIDTLSSFHLGMPLAIRTGDGDTGPPRNLLDTDIDEAMSELPPSRPFSQHVPLGHMLVKDSILGVVKRIVESLNSVHAGPYEVILQLDRDLDQAYATIPAYLRLNGWENAHKDHPPYLLLQKVQLDTLYHQTVSVLHRRYLQDARSNPKFALSEQRCVDSSMILLNHQISIYKETQPGGCLNPNYRYILPPESLNFTLASMVLCLYLQYKIRTMRKGPLYADTKHQKILQVLNTSHAIWKLLSNEHYEAGKVANVLDKILEQLRAKLSFPDKLSVLELGAPFNSQSATLSESSLGVDTNCTQTLNIEMSDFNWDVWDSFVQGGTFETAYLSLLDQEPSLQSQVGVNNVDSSSAEWLTNPCATSEQWDQEPEPMLRPQLGAIPRQHISGSSHPPVSLPTLL